jgi:hypothetical protein
VPVAQGGNILKAASEAVVRSKRFFTASSTAKIRSVYDYFATYETELAVLLTNYWNSKPETYLPQVRAANVEQIRRNIVDQKTVLKPPPPPGTVIDTKTNKMWTTNFGPNPVDTASFFKFIPQGDSGTASYPPETNGPRKIAGLPGDNWNLPSENDFATLVDSSGGRRPVEWLLDEAGMSRLQTDAPGSQGLAFMKDGFKTRFDCGGGGVPACYFHLDIFRFDLWSSKPVGKGVRMFCGYGSCDLKKLRHEVEGIKGSAMYVRDLAPDESYWWR